MHTQDHESRPFSVTRTTDVPVGESVALQPEVPISPGSGPREVLVTRELHRHAGEPGAQCAECGRVAGRTGRQQGAGDVREGGSPSYGPEPGPSLGGRNPGGRPP